MGGKPTRHAAFGRWSGPTLLAACLAALLCCSPAATTVRSAPARRVTSPGPSTLGAASMQEGLERILRVFDDTAGQAALTHVRWEAPAADPGPRARNLSLLLAALRDQELTVLTIQPPSYEALYALTSVPVLTCLVVLYFDGHEVTPLARDRLLSLEPALLAEYAANVSVHTIEQLSSRSGVYSVRTLDGLTVEGLPTDDITGQVFPAERPDGWEGYAQVVGHFTVTRLSPFDIQSHLEEWFHQLPYLYGVPRSRQAR